MSVKFKEDYSFGTNKEDVVISELNTLGYEVEKEWKTSIHDLKFSKDWISYSWEIKTRRCDKDTYPDTLIGANKLWEAWNKYYSSWVETIFFFVYQDWIYYIRPFEHIPRKDFLLQRWDRWIDSKKWWIYYDTKDLINIKELWNTSNIKELLTQGILPTGIKTSKKK